MNQVKYQFGDLIKPVLLGLIVGFVLVIGIYQFQKLTEKLNNLESEINSSIKINEGMSTNIEDNYNTLNQKIESIPTKIKYDRLILESKLMQVNVYISNKTRSAIGSGVTLKYKDKFYVLSAGHMAESKEDKLFLNENGQEICELEIVKQEFDPNLSPKGHDLILLRPKNSDIVPRIYIELAEVEPGISEEIYIVGNTLGMEDVISKGRVNMYLENFMYVTGDSYFGNSGGGIYNEEGKLVGIMSHIFPIQPYPDRVLHPKSHKDSLIVISGVPAYVLNGVVRLREIVLFLEGV